MEIFSSYTPKSEKITDMAPQISISEKEPTSHPILFMCPVKQTPSCVVMIITEMNYTSEALSESVQMKTAVNMQPEQL